MTNKIKKENYVQVGKFKLPKYKITCTDMPSKLKKIKIAKCPRTVSGNHLWGTHEFETSYGMPKCKYCNIVWDLGGEPK